MWPRLIAQLVELLPHATRLLPMADNYLSTRREADRSQATAMAAFSGSIREEVNRVADSFNSVSRELADQKQQIATLQHAIEVAETHSITQTKQLEWITNDLNTLRVWVKFGLVIVIVLLAALTVLTVQILRLR